MFRSYVTLGAIRHEFRPQSWESCQPPILVAPTGLELILPIPHLTLC